MLDFVKRWWMAAAAAAAIFMFALLAQKSTRARTAQKISERKVDELLAADIGENLAAAEKETEKANVLKKKARDAATDAQARLDNIGSKDEKMADILSSWSSERVRQQSS